MKRTVPLFAAAVTLAALLALAAGCGTTMPSRFYRMYPTAAEGARPGPAPSSAATMSVGIGPVELPGYLDRPQIVTRKGERELGYAEYDRWAGSLKGNIADVLTEDVSAALAGEGVSVVPWGSRAQYDYQVAVRIDQFEGYPGKSVNLKADWTVISTASGKVVATRRSVIEKDARGTGYAEYVDAMNGALTDLSREISEALHSLHAGGA